MILHDQSGDDLAMRSELDIDADQRVTEKIDRMIESSTCISDAHILKVAGLAEAGEETMAALRSFVRAFIELRFSATVELRHDGLQILEGHEAQRYRHALIRQRLSEAEDAYKLSGWIDPTQLSPAQRAHHQRTLERMTTELTELRKILGVPERSGDDKPN